MTPAMLQGFNSLNPNVQRFQADLTRQRYGEQVSARKENIKPLPFQKPNGQERAAAVFNTNVALLCEQGRLKEALGFLENQTAQADSKVLIRLLQECGGTKAVSEGRRVHHLIIRSKLEQDIFLGNHLLIMYSKCGSLTDVQNMFEKMQNRNIITWNVLIGAYIECGHHEKSLELLRHCREANMVPNRITFVTILTACCSPDILGEGKLIHAQILDAGYEEHVIVGSALVNMYGKCGNLDGALRMFKKMPERNIVTWNGMISLYVHHNDGKRAIELFRQMQEGQTTPNKITFTSIFNICNNKEDLAEGKLLHAHVLDYRFELDVIVGTALVNMYSKCGSLEFASKAFKKIRRRDIVSWNSMIAAYTDHGRGDKGLQLFRQLQLEGLKPDKIMLVSALDACADLAAMDEGSLIHAHVVELGFETDVIVGSTLINMYAKCGSLHTARNIFDKVQHRDLIIWNAMIAGYAQNGYGDEALKVFVLMQSNGVDPDDITFLSIISACSHSPYVGNGCHLFLSMQFDYGVIPRLEHNRCMIDLLGRAGWLDETEDHINEMPFHADSMIWKIFLAACKVQRNVPKGEYAAQHAIELDPLQDSSYVLLSNMYSEAGMWDDVAKVRKMMADKGITKKPGCSSIEINCAIHEFLAGDQSHPQSMEIYAELEKLYSQLRDAGYVPSKALVLDDLELE